MPMVRTGDNKTAEEQEILQPTMQNGCIAGSKRTSAGRSKSAKMMRYTVISTQYARARAQALRGLTEEAKMAGQKNKGLMVAIYAAARSKGVSPWKVIDEVINTHPVYLKPPPKIRSEPRRRIVNGQYWPLYWCLPRSERPRCGAQTRAGSRCKRIALRNGKCRNHGGMSTGPKSEAGKVRIAEAQRRRWAAHRAGKVIGQA
jgi:hypothetical protein